MPSLNPLPHLVAREDLVHLSPQPLVSLWNPLVGDTSSGSTGELAGDAEGEPPVPSASGVSGGCPPRDSAPTGDNRVLHTQAQTEATADLDKVVSSRPAETGEDVRPITEAEQADTLSAEDP